MTAYDAAQWSDLFVAAAGASAALAGLVFVAVSINIDRILKLEGLPERALETVLLLLSVVVVSLLGLIPGQGSRVLGAELLAQGLVFVAIIGALTRRTLPRGAAPRSWLVSRVLLMGTGTLPLVAGGASLLAGGGGGLYWTAAGMVFAVAGGVVNAWVLLVEILR